MIVAPQAGSLRIVTQADHAAFACELLALWRADRLPDHPRREDLLFATREHDNGWWEADAAPRVDPTSLRPCPFTELPGAERRELWGRGVRRFLEQRPRASLLILEHARRLHADRRDLEEWREFLQELTALQDELLERLQADSADELTMERLRTEVAQDYEWLDLADALSLLACGWGTEVHRPGRPGRRARLEGENLIVEPFPLAGATTFRIPCRTIPDREYRGTADLGGELASARWEELSVRVVAP